MIKNCVSKELLADIPEGRSASAISKRKAILKRELEPLVNKVFRNRYLSSGVLVFNKTIGVIISHSSQSYKSTVAALHLKQAIMYATVLYVDLPKDGNQKKRFGAWITIIMRCEIDGVGVAKLTLVDSLLGDSRKGVLNLDAYCLT